MNPFRKPQTQYLELGQDTKLQIERLIKAIEDRNDLSAVIEMLRGLAHLPAELGLLKDKLDLMHELLVNLDNSAELQRQVDELTSKINLTATEQQDALNKVTQPKEK